MNEPTLDMLATAGGLAGVVFLITNIIRGVINPVTFDKWGAVVAIVVGSVLAIAYVIVTTENLDLEQILQGLLVGLFGGTLSQNVNRAVSRASGNG